MFIPIEVVWVGGIRLVKAGNKDNPVTAEGMKHVVEFVRRLGQKGAR